MSQEKECQHSFFPVFFTITMLALTLLFAVHELEKRIVVLEQRCAAVDAGAAR